MVGDKLVIALLIVNTFGVGYDKLDGAKSITAMETTKVVFPPELVAVTVKFVADCNTVGIPEMIPVDELKLNPFGKAGEIAKVRFSPVAVGDKLVIVWLIVNIFGVG